jgi:hypothetical protein
MKITNRKFDSGHSKQECSRPLWCGPKLTAVRGKAMNGMKLFCSCGLYMCGNKEMFKVKREVIRALELCL